MKIIKTCLLIGLVMQFHVALSDVQDKMHQANSNLYATTWGIVRVAITIGLCSYVTDFVLCRFQVTRNLEYRGTIATGSCVALYAAFLASAYYYGNDDACKKNMIEEDDEQLQDCSDEYDVQD